MATLFISDLHLPAGASPLRDAFARLLRGPARQGAALYILGDLFEYWIGDDEGLASYPGEVAELRALTASGVPVFFQHGNRDFLVGRRFAEATGVRLLPDPFVVDLYGRPTLIAHGDALCTGDVRYQKWRRFARHPLTHRIFLAMPRPWRRRVAGGVRATTTADVRSKAAMIMDVAVPTVESAFRAQGVDRMIHGHTHRPMEHVHVVDGRACERIVLSDWRAERIEALVVDAAGARRTPL